VRDLQKKRPFFGLTEKTPFFWFNRKNADFFVIGIPIKERKIEDCKTA
jgi:hypothetical protein